MSTPFHNTVALDGINFEDSMVTVLLAAGITAADVGKALSKDGTTANRFKLAADDDIIVGRLETFENRRGVLMGTIAFRFIQKLPIKAAAVIAIGNTAVGAGGGEIKGATFNGTNLIVDITDSGTKAVVVRV
jgi:hypothetical protein